ncbi:Receptor-type guanylate cyclase gcy [Seminavis robusta]|uniref:Receptor-type guanylate cyclase gcy n=1 Tax=Seminavis robusta TaxID=568900 RepID=A0A9N8EU91_9STRA|nr:Receptor-type guanylate cyclase gcy [Seminavis robusta]|eukprot:Sro1981_g309160.1 Receptor-type guanylate cyclase gcy (1193) ;mRNA; f:5133-10039
MDIPSAAFEDEFEDDSSRGGSSHYSGYSEETSRKSIRTTGDTSSSDNISQEGKNAVVGSKLLVLLILAVAAAGVGYATFRSTAAQEQTVFETQFHDYSYELTTIVHQETKAIFLSLENFVSTVTSYSLDEGAQWPFVTVPHFEVRGTTANELSGATILAMSPIVPLLQREAWEDYATANQEWIQEGLEIHPDWHEYATDVEGYELKNITYPIWRYAVDGQMVPDLGKGPYLPVWQMATAPHDPAIVNYNLLDHPVFARVFSGMQQTDLPVLSEVTDLEFFYGGAVEDDANHPHSFILYPIHQTFSEVVEHNLIELLGGNTTADNNTATTPEELTQEDNPIVAAATAVLAWDKYFSYIMPEDAIGLVIVVKDTCGDEFTYQVDGPTATFLGNGDLHDPNYNYLEQTSPFVPFIQWNFTAETHEHCEYHMYIYPSETLHDKYLTSKPAMYTAVVVLVFVLTTMVFVMYDFFVQLRNRKVVAKAKRSNAIVSALFPKNVRDRIMKEAEEQVEAELAANKKGRSRFAAPKTQLKSFLSDGQKEKDDQQQQGVTAFGGKPIADLFPSATVMFADISGFTAWSSVREPTQVFQLLETLYNAFDEIAGRRRVFKVETIGDCYVAVAGLPEPRKDHAVVMARFARDCIGRMNDLTKLLEVSLGPDTGDLAIRVGMHSGPVTAGVLRGEKARFQLFGDTVNTASRMESNGIRNKIHISGETADHLKAAGKMHWLVPREEKIVAKGKGEMQTYWLEVKMQSSGSATSKSTESSDHEMENMDASQKCMAIKENLSRENAPVIRQKLSPKAHRLVKWNVEIISRLLKQVVSRRNELTKLQKRRAPSMDFRVETSREDGTTVIDEVKEIIELPEFDAKAARDQQDPQTIQLDPKVESQLLDYISLIASMYREVPFHNFEHASHVTMSVTKLLSRIIAPDDVVAGEEDNDEKMDKNLHDHTYGITSDPLTQLATIFSALIHDVDHTGVPNAQLVKEGVEIADIYKGKSVAEQNSIDIAWELLMDPSFEELRHTIYGTAEEKKRFRQLLVNVVLATDIVDKELKELRNNRWDKAFKGDDSGKPTALMSREEVNRKATIVLEHIIQASDISHTMQHWHVYRKWNERFFDENMKAYKEGRMEKDPSEFWYKGEIGFFDFYIIPLAKKLKECGVFGVSSDEYLNYATQNRREWELRGEEVLAEMMQKYQQ